MVLNSYDYPPKQGLYLPEFETAACGVGFVVKIDGKRSHQVVSESLTMLLRMKHRGACGCEDNTGDGAGIMTGIPHEMYQTILRQEGCGFTLPAPGQYATGLVFFDTDRAKASEGKEMFEEIASTLEIKILGWREVPFDNSTLGPTAAKCQPYIKQVFVTSQSGTNVKEFRKLLFMLRKIASNKICTKSRRFYICTLSPDVVVYKGMFTVEQLSDFFIDLQRPDYLTHFALIHSRFSTNTFPSWERAHPNRYLAHNGEINTVRGNVNNMKAREGVMASQCIGEEFKRLYPAIEENLTDSGCFDNALELLINAGSRSLPEAVMTMVPEAWQNDATMSDEKRNFYKWSSCAMEPWDGPALFTFSDGRYVGAVLDRNGLRPSRYCITQQGCVMMASEVGVNTFSDEDIVYKGRLKPGRMLLVDTEVGTIVKDEELKHQIASLRPTGQWLKRGLVTIKDLKRSYLDTNGLIPGSIPLIQSVEKDICRVDNDPRMTLFGYSVEDVSMLIVPMIKNRKEALGSMGNDTPLACLSSHPQLVFDYFKQLFAQVTNPPIDPIRERIVMSLACPIGPEGNLLEPGPNQCKRLYLEQPVLTCADVQVIRDCILPQWKCKTLDMVYPVIEGVQGLLTTLDKLCEQASKAVKEGYAFILLSDKTAGPSIVPVSSLLALGAVHQHLIKTKQRRSIGILVESGEAREVHHICCLLGFGADAVCPYFMFEIISNLRKEGLLEPPLSDQEIVDNYITAADLGISKVMAKMGISTLHSYKGAQIFEAVGLDPTVVQKCFTGTASRLNGVTFEILAQEALDRHSVAFCERECDNVLLNNRGDYHWRDGGEKHINDPQSIANLQAAAKNKNQNAYQKYVQSSNLNVKACTLRGQLTFKFKDKPLDLSEVESASEIVKRFCTGAMSFGSISIETHTTLAVAMNRIGGKSNTGEGGEDPNRAAEESRSAIKQVASGRFGVTGHYLSSADELQIKMAQGAKPGEGGELPGHKITHEIAKTRKSVKGVGLISPPPHHDIYSIEDLAELIYNLKCANPKARISVKLVSEVGVGIVASGVAKAKAEHIVISGHDGGTGASTWTGVKHAGLPWELGLAETHQTLVLNDLRRRVVLQTDGQMKTGRDVVIAALLGADEFGFSTAPLIALGCTMMRKCHLNTCPVGIATQDPILRKKFEGKPEHVINYMFMVAEEVRDYMAKLGFRKISDMIGRCDMLMPDAKQLNHKSKLLDFAAILTPSWDLRPGNHAGGSEKQEHSLAVRKDNQLIKEAHDVLKGTSNHVYLELPIQNVDRAFGSTLSVHHISRMYGEEGLKNSLIHVKVKGSAGQSFGAFLARGIKLELEGDANDYVGKGLSGGTLVAYPSQNHGKSFRAEQSVIVGNTCLYGGTSGKAFFRGITGERFCVRNSGVTAVSEGVGDHCCEYMTGGITIVLGPTGRNFAAGMSGGVAFVWDPDKKFIVLCNKESVEIEEVLGEDCQLLKSLVEEHKELTRSTVAKHLLEDWEISRTSFVKVMPRNYKKALEKLKEEEKEKKLRKEITVENKEEKNEEASPPLTKKLSEPAVADIEDVIQDSTMEQQIIDRVLDKTRGFVKYARSGKPYRSAKQRIKDWKEIYNHKRADLKVQTARCMDCGVPFCQSNTGCPLGNIIPKWNDLIFHDQWKDALHSLLLTNNFPEFTGRVCPAPCEGACVLSINSQPVTIKKIECSIIDHAFEKGWMSPQVPTTRTGRTVAIIGSGPAGLAAASQLNKAGHFVTVYEKNDRCGGLLMYGIPSMKLDKKLVQRRIDLMSDEGISFKTNAEVGKTIAPQELLEKHEAILLAVGSTWPRDIPLPGRNLDGVHFAMNFLEKSQKRQMGNYALPPLDATGKHVIVIGGGDTGVDCIGTSVRQNAKSITTFELLEEPPKVRQQHNNPWPSWPRVFRVEYGHEEVAIKYGRDPRIYNTMSKEFIGNASGYVTGIRTVEVKWVKDTSGRWEMVEIPNSEKVYKADLVLIALGFLGPEKTLAKQFGVKLDPRSNFSTKRGEYKTSARKVYAAGDCRYGQSLVVTAIAEGRQAARQIDLDLMGTTSLAGPGGVINATHPVPVK